MLKNICTRVEYEGTRHVLRSELPPDWLFRSIPDNIKGLIALPPLLVIFFQIFLKKVHTVSLIERKDAWIIYSRLRSGLFLLFNVYTGEEIRRG